jgi:uncharacterized protein HemY
MNTQHSVQKPGWIARILLTVTTLALVVVGFFFFTVALVVGAIIALVIGVRFWWILRKLKRAQGDLQRASTHAAGTSVVDGEYQVVERETTTPQLPSKHQNAEPRNEPDTTANR